MQLLAEASGISRPALYQYFADRSELFLSAFQLLLDENTDAALNALVVNRSLESVSYTHLTLPTNREV